MAITDNRDKQKSTGGLGGGGGTAGVGATQGGMGTRINSFNSSNTDIKTGKPKKVPAPIRGNGVKRGVPQNKYLQASQDNAQGVTSVLPSLAQAGSESLSRITDTGGQGLYGLVKSLGGEVASGYQQLYEAGRDSLGRTVGEVLLGERGSQELATALRQGKTPNAEPLQVTEGETAIGSKERSTIYRNQGPNGETAFSDKKTPGAVEYNPFNEGRAGLSISGNRLGAGLAAMQELNRTKGITDGATSGEITGTRGTSHSDYVASQQKQKERQDLMRAMSSPGEKTRFGTATTVGGRANSPTALLSAFAQEDSISQRANAAAAADETNRLGLQVRSEEGAADREIKRREGQRSLAKDINSQSISLGKLGESQRANTAREEGNRISTQKNILSAYAKAQETGMGLSAVVSADLRNNLSQPSLILDRNPQIRRWANESESPTERTDLQIVTDWLRAQGQ